MFTLYCNQLSLLNVDIDITNEKLTRLSNFKTPVSLKKGANNANVEVT